MEQMLKSRYQIREQIGHGAFGVIYHALDEENDREIAIKVWKTGSETEIFSYENSPFLRREEQIPGIVKIYDYFEKAGMNFLVMEYLPGGTLKQKADALRKENSPEKILKLFGPVLEGLAFLHSEGLVHCDISPDNLMFDEAGNLKLIDLGACRGKDIICDRKFLKEGYSAPEQYTDPVQIGPWTDVYAVCAVLFEMLTGEKPPSAAERLQNPKLRPISYYTKADRQTEQAILQGLNLEIQQRYFSMELLLHRLGLDTEKAETLAGSTRHFWGQKWIQLSGLGTVYHTEKKKKSFRMIKRIGTGILGIILIAGSFHAGNLWIQNRDPAAYFEQKAGHLKERGIAEKDERLISSLDKDYETILKKLTRYTPEMEEEPEDGSVFCELTEDELVSWNVPDNLGRKMYLDKESVRKVLFSEMGFHEKNVQIETKKESSGFVSRSVDGSYELLRNSSSSEESWKIDIPQEGNEDYKISYDPVDQRVICLSGNMTDPGRLQTFLETLFPVCCPEGYLSAEEIKDLQKRMEQSEESMMIQVAPHSWVSLFGMVDTNQKTVRYYVKIAASKAGLLH